MYISTEDVEEDEDEELDEQAEELEYLTLLQESLMIRAMTGSSSQKLATIDPRLLFMLR